jgi:hypothetical protein
MSAPMNYNGDASNKDLSVNFDKNGRFHGQGIHIHGSTSSFFNMLRITIVLQAVEIELHQPSFKQTSEEKLP